jgi:hypothetical protein
MTRTRHSRSDQYLSVFDDTLFAGLLHSVPQAFQRTAATAGAWRRVASLRDRIYRRALQLSRDEDIIERLDNILTECEWALLAGLTCSSAFHHSPLYELRCHDERYYSRSELKAHHESANRRIKERLLLASDLPELCKFRPDIRSSVARGAFQAAYYEFESGSRTRAWRYLLDAARTDLKWQFVKFGVRTLLPRGIRKNF